MTGRIIIGWTLLLWLLLPLGRSSGQTVVYTEGTQSGQTVVYTEGTETAYSEYYELNRTVLDGRLRVHLLITLGDERLPAGTRFVPGLFVDSDGNITESGRADGWIEEVHEIYFTNLGDSPIDLSELELKITGLRPARSEALSPDPFTIEPGSFVKTEPLIYLGNIYRQAFEGVEVHIIHEGEKEIVQGTARRLPVDELP